VGRGSVFETAVDELLTDIRSPECGTHGFAHRDECLVASGRGIVTHVDLDPIGNGNATPAG
jgi:hypothetical protein